MRIDAAFVAETLRHLPQADVEHRVGEDRLLLRIARKTVRINVVARASGYPRDVFQAVRQARQRSAVAREKLLIAVPALTASSREWLQQEGVAYLDGQGNLFVSADGVYIFREAASVNRKSSGVAEPRIFRGRATQVLHALLHAPERPWHITELAAEAGVAAGTALKVCETLEKMLLMEREGRGPQSFRRLSEPGKLLDAWSENHRLDAYRTSGYYLWSAGLSDLASVLADFLERDGTDYAFTLDFGALQRAPLLAEASQVALLLPRAADPAGIARSIGLIPAEEGANVLLLGAQEDTPLMYRQKIENLWVASDVQLYLDLMASPARGKEQAAHLRRERLRF